LAPLFLRLRRLPLPPSALGLLLILLAALAIARFGAQRLARWAIPAIVVELLIGLLLGNSLLPFEAIKPLAPLTELGVLTLFFQVGLEVSSDLLSARRTTILRLVALSARGDEPYSRFRFRPDDWLLFGCESNGLPESLLPQTDALLVIPMSGGVREPEPGVRSLNLSVAVGVVLFEALRQLESQ